MGTAGGEQVYNRNQGKPSPGDTPSLRGVEGVIAPPRGKKGSLSCEQDRDGPIRVVLQRLAAQECMNVIQQFVLLLVKLNNWIYRIHVPGT
jgi:hypothetical protein